MIIAKIVQDGQIITLKDALKTFQYSANLQMQFIRDDRYKDYILTGWYRCFKDKEYMLDINEDGIFTLGKDIFAKKGTVEFSFSLNRADGEIIHLGVIEYVIEQSFGSGDAILPEEQDTWIQVVSRVVEDQVSHIWDKDYKPQLEENLNIIESKTEEIKTSAAEVKHDALESSTNAQNALDSANLARESADNAKLAEEKALEHMSNAEKFKNDAFTHSNQANLAKTEASKSATNAGNSATSALDSSNKAQQHLNSIVEKVNAFNADYTNKVNNFNTSVENANNVLDKKIADANGVIDAKVQVATEQADIATSKATQLKDAVDKVNYLEDALDTKLTQPYVSSPVIENATISDSDEGQLRNLRVYGKCTQKVETDIVPTPEREVPIVSKKITVGGEIVELRSLKESVNLFDIKLNGFMYGLLDSYGNLNTANKNYASTDFISVRPNTQYFSGVFGTNINSSGIFFFDKNKEIVSKTDTRPFVTPSGCYYVRCGITINGSTLLEDLSIANNAFVFCKGGAVNAYIPQTIRDYKIVDHVNKRSWIERNVTVENLSSITNWAWNGSNMAYSIISKLNKNSPSLSNYFSTYMSPSNYINGLTVNINKAVCIKDPSFNTLEDAKNFLSEQDVLCYAQLETPTTEEIPYLESDESEIGISYQDTTSPSLNIPSEIETISTLNIRVCAKNMFNPQGLSGGEIVDHNGVKCYKYKDSNNNFIFDFSHNNIARQFTFTTKIYRDDGSSNGTYMHFLYEDGSRTTMQIQKLNEILSFTSNPDKILKKIVGNYSYAKTCYIDLLVTQLEEGDTATEYQPYEETAIIHELENPLVKCGDVADTIDLVNLERTNNNYYGLLDLANQGITYGGLVGNYRSCYWRANTMPKPKLLNNNFDKNNLICSRFVADLNRYNSNIGETISIYKDGSADFIATFNVNRFKDVAEFKQFFIDNPTMVAYPLATPTTEPLEPELVEKLKQLKTFYPITHIFSNAPLEFHYKLNMPAWHKVVSGQVEDARDVIYNMQVQQNNLEVMQLESSLNMQYNMDLLKLGGNLC